MRKLLQLHQRVPDGWTGIPESHGAEEGVGPGGRRAQADVAAFVLDRMSPEEADSAFAAALQVRLEVATASEEFSGAVLVTRNGTTLFEGAYGLANRPLGIPNSLLTKFRGTGTILNDD